MVVEYETQELEQSIIGRILKSPDCLSEVGLIIEAGDFYHIDHQNIYSAIDALYENKKPITLISIQSLMDTRKQRLRVEYLKDIIANTASSRNISHYAGVLASKSKERKLYQVADDILGMYHEAESAEDKIDRATAALMAIGETKSADVHDMTSILKNVVSDLEDRFERGEEIIGIPSGLKDVDERIKGYRAGDLVIIAARPAMGKTTYAMNIANKDALAGGTPLIFSLEMPKEKLSERSISDIGNIPGHLIRSGNIMGDQEHSHKMFSAVKSLMDSKMKIIDKAGISINEVRAISRRQNRLEPVSMILIDYLQLMDVKGDNRNEGIGQITVGLKSLAKELGCPIFALSQLNRSLESRSNKRPQMSDLRESGSIEQDADIIQFLYRDKVYDENTKNPDVAEVITGKFREGDPGTDYVTANLMCYKFQDFNGVYNEPEPRASTTNY